jgi:rubrerythrin
MERTITVTQYECEHCHHTWVPRYARRPGVCPVCKRADWDRPARAQTNGHKKGKK